jgi:hypothetical protein
MRHGDEISVSVPKVSRVKGMQVLIPARRMKRALIAGALLLALPVGGCATSIADLPLVGVPADAPARPKEAGAYPAVHDLPQDRPEAAMDTAERNKVANELIAARDRQASTAAAQTAPKNPAGK